MSAARSIRRTAALATLLAIPVQAAPAIASLPASQDEGRWAELDNTYAFGPTAARKIGYRIGWQATMDGPVEAMTSLNESVFTVGAGGLISRVAKDTGQIIWSNSAVDRNHLVWGVTEGLRNGDEPWGSNPGDTVCIVCDTTVTHLDHSTGAIVRRDDLGKAPSSGVVRHGRNLVYGTHLGQVVWFNYKVGFEWRATQLWGPVVTTPVIHNGLVGAVSSMGNEIRKGKARRGDQTMIWGPDDDPQGRLDRAKAFWKGVNPERGDYEPLSRSSSIGLRGGSVGVLNAATAGVVWGEGDMLFEGVSAVPVFGSGLMYCAGLDQYLWALDESNGERVWRYLAPAALTTNPAFVSLPGPDDTQLDLVLQWVDGVGTLAFEAAPANSVDGVVVWTSANAKGDLLGTRNGRILLWDDESKRLQTLDPVTGEVVQSINLPKVEKLEMIDDSIFVIGDRGRVLRLDPTG